MTAVEASGCDKGGKDEVNLLEIFLSRCRSHEGVRIVKILPFSTDERVFD